MKYLTDAEKDVIKFYLRSRCKVCHLANNWVDDNDRITVECLIGRTIEDCPLIDIVWCEECTCKDTDKEYPDCMVLAGCRRGERRNNGHTD